MIKCRGGFDVCRVRAWVFVHKIEKSGEGRQTYVKDEVLVMLVVVEVQDSGACGVGHVLQWLPEKFLNSF